MVDAIYKRKRPQIGDVWLALRPLYQGGYLDEKLIISEIQIDRYRAEIIQFITASGRKFWEYSSTFQTYCKPVDED
jgi:hypothetical protein